MSAKITRHFIRVGGREVHCRTAGSGPPFVLFHVSPQSSAFVLPELIELADRYTLIGLDSPGYGESDPLPLTAPTMADYADAMAETFAALGLKNVPVYGSHTGANIAVELARRSPSVVSALVLDGLSLSTPEVAHDRQAHYAPRFTPTADGAHLAWAWQHTRDQLLFWPWYQPHQANRLHGSMKNADYLHDVVWSKMAAADYWLGYRAAFNHDSRDALKQVGVPTYFVTTIADEHTAVERSIPDLPETVHFVDTTEETKLDVVRDLLKTNTGDAAFAVPSDLAPLNMLARSYVDVNGEQRLVRRIEAGAGKPVVMLHGARGTSALLMDQAKALNSACDRPVLAVDIAGNGDSDPLSRTDASLADYAEDVQAVIAACEITKFDVYGEGIGALLALEVARLSKDAGCKLILDRPEIPEPGVREDLLANAAPPIEARWDGTHFLTAWHMLRDAALFWPWYQRTADGVRNIEPDIEPVALQSRVLAWLKGRKTYGGYIRACYAADAETLLKSCPNQTLVLGTMHDVLEGHANRCGQYLSTAQVELSEWSRPATSTMSAFLNS